MTGKPSQPPFQCFVSNSRLQSYSNCRISRPLLILLQPLLLPRRGSGGLCQTSLGRGGGGCVYQNFLSRCQQPPNRKSQPELTQLKPQSLSQSNQRFHIRFYGSWPELLCRAVGGSRPMTARERLTQTAVTENLGRIKEKLLRRGQFERRMS